MGQLFTPEELRNVLDQRSKTRDKKEFVRLSVLIMVDRDFSYQDISVAHGVHPATIGNWRSEFKTGGLKAVLSDYYKPFTGYLTEEELEQVGHYVDNTSCFTSKQVGDWIESKFGLVYTESGVTAILHRLGFSYKQVSIIGHKADPEKQEQFVKEFGELMASLEENDKVFFTDGVHPSHNIHMHCQWIRKGERREVPCNTGRQRVNLLGAVNALDATEVTTLECQTVNADATIELFESIKASNPKGKKYIICDNARYLRSRKVAEWISGNQDVKLVFLPAYSPNLNVIERLWRHMKKKVCTKFFEKFEEFRQAILGYFDTILDYKDELETLLILKFKIQQKPTYFEF